MITILNQQRAFAIDIERMQAQLAAMLKSLGYDSFDVSVLICGTQKIRFFNRTYRQKDKATDVLSFPFEENRNPETRIIANSEEEANLGDLILCPRYIAATCHKWDRDFDTHLTALLAHGLAHLIGHDHITDEQFARMAPVEEQLIQSARGI